MKTQEKKPTVPPHDDAVPETFRRRRVTTEPVKPWDRRSILIGLMVPMGMTVLNLSMFGVALPFIRDGFDADPDVIAWLVTAYTLPFVMFMPLYGRLGDGLGKRRLFTIGIILFFIGTGLCLMAEEMWMLFLGRIVQGLGTAGVNPLCIAIITELFPPKEKGKAMGTWSSTGPAIGMLGPFLGGFLIDRWGWQTIFIPGVVASLIALYVVRDRVPKLAPEPQHHFLRSFDWLGTFLLSCSIVLLVSYLSSRILTGVAPLQDWRLLLLTVVAFSTFLWWERRHAHPLVPLHLFTIGAFGRSSLAASLRMFLMSSEGFLVPLYMADIHGLSGSEVGFMLTLHAGSLLVTVRLGGQIADRWNSRWPMNIGFGLQVGMMTYFAFLPGTVPIWMAAAGLVFHGLGAGMSLAVLHRTALDQVPPEDSGAAAGLYSMSRFFGSIIGTTLGGVVLATALARTAVPIAAYQIGFGFVALVGVFAFFVIWGIRDPQPLAD
ncbi:MAG: MFS transporter [Litorilinea sp.]